MPPLPDQIQQRPGHPPEGGMNALIAGHFGVPVVMISGDDAAVREVSDMLGPIEGAVVVCRRGGNDCLSAKRGAYR